MKQSRNLFYVWYVQPQVHILNRRDCPAQYALSVVCRAARLCRSEQNLSCPSLSYVCVIVCSMHGSHGRQLYPSAAHTEQMSSPASYVLSLERRAARLCYSEHILSHPSLSSVCV